MSKHLIEVEPVHETGAGAGRVMIMSTLAFTLMFAVWLMFGILGVPIQKELGLTDVELSWISALAVLNGSMWRLPAGLLAAPMRAVRDPRPDPPSAGGGFKRPAIGGWGGCPGRG